MLSVIIPIYNSQSSIKKCVESVLSQGVEDLEVLLIDDGSKDSSLDICKQLAQNDARVKVFSKENGGAASARNLGLEKCCGDYVCFVDSDDYLEGNYLTVLLEKIKSADLVICGMNILKKEGEESHDIRQFNTEGIIPKDEFYKMYKEINFEGVFASSCNKIYKKQLIQNKFQNFLIGEDKFFNYDYLKQCESILITNDVRYNYVYYSNPTSVTKLYKDGKFENILKNHQKEMDEAKLIFGETNIQEYMKYLNRTLLRDLTSIMVGLTFSNKTKKEIRSIITTWVNHEMVHEAASNYASFGVQEKIIFKLIQLKAIRPIVFLCKMKGEK